MSDDPRIDRDPRFDQAARSWLELGPTTVPERSIQSVLLAVETTPQGRGLRVPWRNSRMMTLAAAVATAALALVFVIGPAGLVPLTTTPSTSLPPTTCPAPLESGSIATIAGTSAKGSDGDGGAAIDAAISPSIGIAVDEAGNVYFTEEGSRSVRRIGTDGVITTVASAATGADFVVPLGLAFSQDGSLYVSDLGASRIWRVEDDGSTTAVVGTGVSGSSGNEGPALEAEVQPAGLAIGPDGDFYFDDLNNYRRVDPEGTIHAFAGSTEQGFGGDGGPATAALFGEGVMGIATDDSGNVYLGDPGNLRIRKVDPAGTIASIAGTGKAGSSGEGRPALEASISNSPFGLALDAAGSLYFSEWQRNAVRKIDPTGTVTTVVGGGGQLGDCGPAAEASVMAPQGIAIRDGVLYIVDSGRSRIRIVVP
jgi:sugar lactone lactonase YvrE